ncbi:HAD family hydrolase [Pedobacter sp.]|uniref:HAD family hydrolase n=1 Tax=Pedobacter sp. TaxID=1411316 RepID=UPI003BAB7BA3
MCINHVPENIKLVIFDVDGTLYDQSKLRNKMIVALVGYYLLRPWKYYELLIIYHFRKEREKKAGFTGENLYNEQFMWCASKVNLPVEKVKAVIDKWIFQFPNKYLKNCMYPGVKEIFNVLKANQIALAIYSDYDSKEKMASMGIEAQLLVSSTDSTINSMKPLPKALNYIAERFNINDKNNCIFIGDREELDGECAKNADIPFLLINKKKARNNFYSKLSKEILNGN